MDSNYIKTKNLNLILYGFLRKLKKGDEFSYTIQNQEKVTVLLKNRKEIQNLKLVMPEIANIKRLLARKKVIEINIEDKTFCNIKLREGYYYIDNADKVLQYVIFEIIQGCSEILLVPKVCNDYEVPTGYNFSNFFKLKSQYFCDTTISQSVYSSTYTLAKQILNVTSKDETITLVTKRETFTFCKVF